MTENAPNQSSADVDVAALSEGMSPALRVNKRQLQIGGGVVVVVAVVLLAWNFIFAGPDLAGMITTASHEIHAGSYASAETLLNDEIAKNTSNVHNYNAIAYYDLGVAKQKQGDDAGAINYYQQCINLAPNYRNAWYNKAVSEMSTDRVQSIADFNHVLATAPNDSNSLWNSGLMLYRTGKTTDGIARMKQAIALNSFFASRVPSDINLAG
jgi:tetratricopeptide (TPR) repeat protein